MKKLLLLLGAVSCAQQAEPQVADRSVVACDAATHVASLPPEIDEASGLAVSRRHRGILWVHNDSGEPVLFALDTLGNVRARVRVPKVANDDWEDIAAGPCAEGSCLYIGDIGNNLQNAAERRIYRVPEPALDETQTAVPAIIRFRLPKPEDAEALFVTPDQRIYVITKGRAGPVTLYRLPDNAGDAVAVLQPVQALTSGLVQLPDMITAAGATPNGRYIVIRTYSALQVYAFESDELKPLLATSGFDLQALREFQGEGGDISASGVVYLVSEQGLSDDPPPLSKVTCRF